MTKFLPDTIFLNDMRGVSQYVARGDIVVDDSWVGLRVSAFQYEETLALQTDEHGDPRRREPVSTEQYVQHCCNAGEDVMVRGEHGGCAN